MDLLADRVCNNELNAILYATVFRRIKMVKLASSLIIEKSTCVLDIKFENASFVRTYLNPLLLHLLIWIRLKLEQLHVLRTDYQECRSIKK